MKHFQKDSLDMFKRTSKYVTETNDISSNRQGLIDANIALGDIITSIEVKAGKQAEQTSGVALGKSDKKEALVQKLYLVTSGTAGYAASVSDFTLQGQMNYSLTELRKLSDESIVPITNDLMSIVDPIITKPELNGFGVDAAAVSALTTARDGYTAVQSAPQLAQDQEEAMTQALEPLFTTGRNILRNQMDKAAVTLRGTEPDWWNEYHNTRKIISTGHRTTSVDGDVFTDGTTIPIYGVQVTATHADGTVTVTKTDVNGHYKFIPLKFGVYIMSFVVSGYKDLTLGAFEVKLGQRVVKDVFMEKV